MATKPVSAVHFRRSQSFADLVGYVSELKRIGEAILWPIFDLFLRFWLAQAFWVSGIQKLTNWETALYLSANEYPVSWLDPATAAYLGVTIEILCPILLFFGVATRAAALPMLILSLVIHVEYQQLNTQIYWAVLLGWYVVMGAGALSFDRHLGRGLAGSALPLAGTINRCFELMSGWLGNAYLLFLRCWLALVFFVSGGTPSDDRMAVLSLLDYQYHVTIPAVGSSAWPLLLLTMICPLCLVIGLATRLWALAAALMIAALLASGAYTDLARIDLQYWLLLVGILILQTPGALSVDRPIQGWLRQRFPRLQDLGAEALADLPHVVIVGAGFGGLSVAQSLRNAACRVTIIDRRNYHLFQPLLYQVATATLSPADIATPIRSLLRDQANARVLLGRVNDVDTERKEVTFGDRQVGYDYLVLATGARHSYFGRDKEWEDLAPGLKKIDDATHIRHRLLLAFEKAENAETVEEQRRFLTFVIVGGGPTGVELAGAIAELALHGMHREFRNIDPASARVILVQAAPRVLPMFPEKLSKRTEDSLTELGVEVMTDQRVEHIDDTCVRIGGNRLDCYTVFWAAGVIASPAAKWLDAPQDRAGRVEVGPDLSVAGHENVFAIGDTALSTAWQGNPVPGLAPAAKQAGGYVAKVIRARLEGRKEPGPFQYNHAGSLATIGRRSAVADFGKFQVSGALAWWLWGGVHVIFLAGMRNRISVVVQWFWAYLTFKSSTRLITREDD